MSVGAIKRLGVLPVQSDDPPDNIWFKLKDGPSMKSGTAFLWLCSALFALASCKTRQLSSTPKHIFGRTAIAPSAPLNPCKDGTDYPEAVTYVKELANWIMARNTDTFTADYSPSKFCFAVSDLAGLNAHADPATDHRLPIERKAEA